MRAVPVINSSSTNYIHRGAIAQQAAKIGPSFQAKRKADLFFHFGMGEWKLGWGGWRTRRGGWG